MDKFTVNSFIESKVSCDKITVLTAYDYTSAKLEEEITKAVEFYCEEVKSGVFPDESHTFKVDNEVINRLY